VAHRATLTEALEAALATQDGPVLADRLLRQGLPAGPVLPIDAALAAPHTAAREMLVERDGYRGIGTPVKLSRTPGALRAAPPRFGEHAEEVLEEHGYAAEDIAALEQAGVLFGTRRT
jgi:formyl-CoA transferase